MSWPNVKLIFLRELRDQLRDRRTLFTILVLPLLLYPLLGMSVFQVQQFLKEHSSKVRIIGTGALPERPPLIAAGRIAAARGPERDLELMELELVPATSKSLDDVEADAQRDIQLGKCDLVVYFPPDFAERLAEFRRAEPADRSPAPRSPEREVPQPRLFYNTASDRSKVALHRFEGVLRNWREAVVEENLRQSNLPLAAARPFEAKQTDVAEEVRRRAALWSKLLPFVLMVWALTGAFYPAIDLCAGEKERGTLETLLSSPAARSEIVWGKLLTVMTFSMATSLLNLASMTATGAFIIGQLQRMGTARLPLDLGPPPLFAIGWLVMALVPIAALFSALSLAVAAFARSSKEGQYYLMPLLMISLPLMMLTMLPTAQLELGTAIIPLSGLLLLLRALIEGQYWEALRFSLPVAGVTAACCLLAIRWAIDQFNNESVLFRESERFSLGPWLRHLVRDREDLPTAGEAVLCGVLLLVMRFFFGLAAREPATWAELAQTTLVLQLALVAAPACLMAIILTRRPARALLLARPSFLLTVPAAMVLALLLHPTFLWLGEQIRVLYPINPAALGKLAAIDQMFATAPLWQVVLLVGLTPAICEELAFRGFILSGLRRIGHKWGAIALASLFFGLAHGILQQSLAACVVGLVLGYIAVKTGSLLPAMLYHFTHNSTTVLLGRLTPAALETRGGLAALLEVAPEGGHVAYRLPVMLAGAVLAAAVLWWFKSLPYHRSEEERLQEALDNQPTALPARFVA